MAHKIVSGIDRMATTSRHTVWHAAETLSDGRLVEVVARDPEATLLEMAGIVWPIDADNDVHRTGELLVVDPMFSDRGMPYAKVSTHVATLSLSGRVLGIVGANYGIVPFKAILTDWLLGLAQAGGDPQTLGTFDEGRNFFASFQVAPAWRVPGDDSETLAFCNVIANHTGEGGIRCSYSTFRVVCSNTSGFFSAEHDAAAKLADEVRRARGWVTVAHTKNASERMRDAVAWITDGKARAEREADLLARMASTLVSPAAVETFVDNYIAKPEDATKATAGRREAARAQFRADMAAADLGGHGLTSKGITAYGLYQAVTHFEDWTSTVRSTDETPVGTRRAFRAFLGERETEKATARERILALVS